MSTTVLLADRETATRGFLERRLPRDGFELVAAAEPRPDVVLAGDDAALDRWRGEAPVIVLGRPEADPVDRVRAFRRGCDDYLPRPFHYDELVARIHAVLRRTQRPAEMLVAGPLEIDPRTRVVAVGGHAAPALAEGVRPAAPARRRPAARVHEGGAAARRLGLPRRARARARSTRTCRACAASCARSTPRRSCSRTSGASGYRLLGRRALEVAC